MFRNAILLFLCLANSTARADESILVAVASNMTHVMQEIAAQYKQETDVSVKLSFGSSGNFTSQILQGAPFDIFLSAGKKYVTILIENGYEFTAMDEFARGRIGVFIPNHSTLSDSKDLKQIFKAIQHNQYRKITIANPEHAPYGLAAQQALQNAGLWIIDRHKLLIGENAAQTMTFSLSSGVDLGIIPVSYAILPKINKAGKFFFIPATWHEPIQQHLIMRKGAGTAVKAFYNYLLSDKTKTIIEKYGYTIASN